MAETNAPFRLKIGYTTRARPNIEPIAGLAIPAEFVCNNIRGILPGTPCYVPRTYTEMTEIAAVAPPGGYSYSQLIALSRQIPDYPAGLKILFVDGPGGRRSGFYTPPILGQELVVIFKQGTVLRENRTPCWLSTLDPACLRLAGSGAEDAVDRYRYSEATILVHEIGHALIRYLHCSSTVCVMHKHWDDRADLGHVSISLSEVRLWTFRRGAFGWRADVVFCANCIRTFRDAWERRILASP